MQSKQSPDQALSELRSILETHNILPHIIVGKDAISFANFREADWKIILRITILLLMPAAIIVLNIISKQSLYANLWLVPLLYFIFGRGLLLQVRNQTNINFQIRERYIEIENTSKFFSRYYPTKKIPFASIQKTELIDQSSSSKYGAAKWRELVVVDNNNQRLLLTRFNKEYPSSMIARKMSAVVDSYIFLDKQ